MLTLRHAEYQDKDFLLDLANDPIHRHFSFHSEPIQKESHETWFRKKQNSEESQIYILEDQKNSKAIGQIRFDLKESIAHIDFALIPTERGKGLGSLLLKLGTQKIKNERHWSHFQATVFEENIRSQKSFLKAGFQVLQRKKIFGKDCIIYELKL